MGLFDGIVKGVSGFFGGGTPPPYQTPQRIQNFMQPIPTTEMQAAGHYQNLLDDKQGYDASQQRIDAWNKTLANPDLTDEQRQQATNAVQNWTAYRDAYAQDAENTRKSAAAIGLDVSDYGTDKTLQQSQQAFLTHKNLAVQKFLNDMPTLGELEENRYRELRSRGASPSMANSIVADERGKMNSMLARRLGDFMTTYGKNPDGTIDQDIGIMAMTRVLPDPQSVAQLFASGFAMPSKVFDANQQLASHLALANANNAAEMDRTKWSGNNQLLMSREGITARNDQLKYTVENQNEQNRLQREMQERIAAAQVAARMAGTQKGNELAQEIKNLKELGFDEGTATLAVVGRKYSSLVNAHGKDIADWEEIGRKYFGLEGDALMDFVAQRVGIKPTENREKLEEAGRLFNNTYSNIEAAIKAGNKDTALEEIGKMRGWLKDDLEYAKLLDRANYENTLQRLDVYEKIANGDPKSDEFATWLIKEQFKSEHGREPTHDEIQVEIAKAMKEGRYILPPEKPVKTPSMQSSPTPNPSTNTSAPAYSSLGQSLNTPLQNSASMGYNYGTGAYIPNR